MTQMTHSKREREKAMVSEMIALYCKKRHHTHGILCPDCAALRDYALASPNLCRSPPESVSPSSPTGVS